MARSITPIASAANWVRGLFQTTNKAASGGLVSAGGTRVSYNFGGSAVHEPFAGAWQKGLSNANSRDPNLLAFSGVYACVTIIAQDIAKLPVRVLQLRPDNVSEEVARLNPYHRLLRRPNDYQTPVDFFMLLLACRLIRGNAYAFKEFDARGVPTKLHVLHPDRVVPLIHPASKEIYYQYTPMHNDMVDLKGFPTENGTVFIPARYMVHDRINCLWHPLVGTSPLFAAAMSASMGGRMMLNSERLFANMARPSGILTAPGEINDTTAERLKRDFEANYSSGNIGRTAVLGDGLEWKQMVMTSVDAQLIEQLKWTIEDVARAYRVPMYLLADLTRSTSYKNSEQAAQSYYSGCLQYHIEALERRLTSDFNMDDETTYVAVDVRAMFRMDTAERFGAYKEGIAAGVLAPNEARAFEGLGPVKGGEEPRMQMQYVPLSTPVTDPNAGAPMPDPAPEPEEEDDTDGTPEEDDDEDKAVAMDEMLAIMTRVSAGAARARFAYEGLTK